jgi:hypothetical protein
MLLWLCLLIAAESHQVMLVCARAGVALLVTKRRRRAQRQSANAHGFTADGTMSRASEQVYTIHNVHLDAIHNAPSSPGGMLSCIATILRLKHAAGLAPVEGSRHTCAGWTLLHHPSLRSGVKTVVRQAQGCGSWIGKADETQAAFLSSILPYRTCASGGSFDQDDVHNRLASNGNSRGCMQRRLN